MRVAAASALLEQERDACRRVLPDWGGLTRNSGNAEVRLKPGER